jgi:hypothetical protein
MISGTLAHLAHMRSFPSFLAHSSHSIHFHRSILSGSTTYLLAVTFLHNLSLALHTLTARPDHQFGFRLTVTSSIMTMSKHVRLSKAPETTPCKKCGQDIIIPRTCRHGKKRLNCHGTGCISAHMDEHNVNNCPERTISIPNGPDVVIWRPGPRPAQDPTLTLPNGAPMDAFGHALEAFINMLEFRQIGRHGSRMPIERRSAMVRLFGIHTKIADYRECRPKAIQGVQIDDWLWDIAQQPLAWINV